MRAVNVVPYLFLDTIVIILAAIIHNPIPLERLNCHHM